MKTQKFWKWGSLLPGMIVAAVALLASVGHAQTVHSFNLGGRTVTGDVPAANNSDGLQITGETGTWANLSGSDTSAPGSDVSATDDGVTLTFHSVIWGGTVGDERGNNVGTRAMRMWTGYGSVDAAWSLTGLTPNGTYDMVWYNKRNPPGESRHPNSGVNGFDAGNGVGAIGPLDDDRDQNFAGVQADAAGTISGTWFVAGGLQSITAVAGVQLVPVVPFPLFIKPSVTVPGNYDFRWESKDNKVYDLVWAPDLSTSPDTWDLWDDRKDIPGTAPENTLLGVPGGGPRQFFAMLEKNPPPPALANGSFEEPEATDGGFAALGDPWTTTPASQPIGASIETWDPSGDDYAAVPDGENVCSVYLSGTPPGSPFGVSQLLDADFAANTDYTLSVEVGRSAAFPGAGYDWPGFRVELWAGATLLGSDEDPATTAPSAGNFITSTISYDHTSGPAATPGDPLEVRLLSRGQDVEGVGSSVSGWSVEFDNVIFTSNVP